MDLHQLDPDTRVSPPAVAAKQKWPKVIEVVAPILFYGLMPAAYLATQWTYRTVFITINFWFVFWQLLLWLGLGINFMEEYLEDWNLREVSPIMGLSINILLL